MNKVLTAGAPAHKNIAHLKTLLLTKLKLTNNLFPKCLELTAFKIPPAVLRVEVELCKEVGTLLFRLDYRLLWIPRCECTMSIGLQGTYWVLSTHWDPTYYEGLIPKLVSFTHLMTCMPIVIRFIFWLIVDRSSSL